VSEAHSVIEGMWHGVDEAHPLHVAPSSAIAGEGVVNVYRSIDRLVARLRNRFPEAALMLFSMHGMGANSSDAASMLLLAELLYRDHSGGALFDRQGEPREELNGCVDLPVGQTWVEWIAEGFPGPVENPADTGRRRPRSRLQSLLQHMGPRRRPQQPPPRPAGRIPVNWIPASRYRAHWPAMKAFARPAYYDGQVRLNLQGREAHGIVPLADYREERERIAQLVSECRDPVTDRPVVGSIDFNPAADPQRLGNTESDLTIVWSDAPQGFRHPRLGTIGPVPYRRTGGHTGGHGFAWLTGTPLPPGDHGLRSAFDAVPTLLELLGLPGRAPVSGSSLLGRRVA